MPSVDESTLLLADAAFQSAGAVVLGALVLGWARSGTWRNPLRGSSLEQAGPTLVHVLAVLAAFYVLSVALVSSVRVDRAAAARSGSDAWHTIQAIDAGAKLAVCVLMLFVLHYFRTGGAPARSGLGLTRSLAAGGAAAAVVAAVSCLQLEMTRVIWQWLQPRAEPPVHDVLTAIARSAWGPWGVALLTVTAILVAPLAEELFFRGLLLPALWHRLRHAWLAIALSAAAFGFIHISLPQTVLPLVCMGIVLGYLRVRYRSLAACVVAHALFNARTIVLALLGPDLATAT